MEEETETEIERVHAILGHALKRITQLEAVIANANQENTLDPKATVVDERAAVLLRFIETHGKITTRMAKKLLKTGHYQVHRAFDLLDQRFEEVTITKNRQGMNVLIYNRSPAQVHKLVHLNEIEWPK